MLHFNTEQLYDNIRISILGIAMVVGFFLLLRILRRIEERLSSIPLCKTNPSDLSCFGSPSMMKPGPSGLNGLGLNGLNKPVSSPNIGMMTVSGVSVSPATKNVVPNQDFMEMEEFFQSEDVVNQAPPPPVIEEITEETPEKPFTQSEIKPSENDNGSVSVDESVPGKSKLMRLSADTLREMCVQQGISTEGTRKQLIDRLLMKSA